MRAVQVASGTFHDLKQGILDPFKLIKLRCTMTPAGTKVTVFMLSHCESTETGLRPRFYLNCSHM